MKRIRYFLVISLSLMFITSCGGKSDADASLRWQSERDSVYRVNGQLQTMLNNMTGTVADISLSLDSITRLEKMILLGRDEEGNWLSKRSIKNKLRALSELIANQRERMANMDSSLVAGNKNMSQLRNLIAFLDASLQQKDKEISRLEKEIDRKDFNISKLTEHISTLQDTISDVQRKNEKQREIIDRQEESLYEVFYVIGTKKDLIRDGVLEQSGRFIKRRKVNFGNINKSALIKADIRELKIININGESPKILTEVPKGSYSLETSGSQSVLTISDSDKFWSANNKILVIQIK